MDDLLERGLQLAHFIVGDRDADLAILAGALNKLEARCASERKRAYWREKQMKRWITSITRSETDLFQWLVLSESGLYEKERELSSDPSTKDLVVRYVKELVRITTARSSFYVNIGVSRFLHNYNNAETQRMYELVAERYLGADQYRRVKNLLMCKLEARFGRFLRTVRARHGEKRFETFEDPTPWTQLVRECLTVFTPWSTAASCPALESFSPGSDSVFPGLSAPPQEKGSWNRIELNRCHVFIEPQCYEQLALALGLPSPNQALALPRFFVAGFADEDDTRENTAATTPLTAEERKRIKGNLLAGNERLRRILQ